VPTITTAATTTTTSTTSTSLNIVIGDDKDVDVLQKIEDVFANSPGINDDFDKVVKDIFPGAINNRDLLTKVVSHLQLERDHSGGNTLLATSFCCDELARQLEDDFRGIYGNNFNLGGLAGFPFAGNTGFGAMSAHIPDDGYCLIVYGPHVGIAADGTIGKVERSGIELVDNCCRSAIAASDYVKTITDGTLKISTNLQEFNDFQQGAVQELILPHGKRLAEADDRMAELPYAIFDSQDMLLREIVKRGASGVKAGITLLGGIQINTGPDSLDYFVPFRFDFMNNKGEVVEDMLPSISER